MYVRVTWCYLEEKKKGDSERVPDVRDSAKNNL